MYSETAQVGPLPPPVHDKCKTFRQSLCLGMLVASTRDYDSWNRSRVELRADGWLDRGVDLRLCFKQLREMRRGEIWSIEKFVEEGGGKKRGEFLS